MQPVTMLFEREILQPAERIAALTRLFHETARREGPPPAFGHVPVSVLEAHGEFSTRVRYLIEAAEKQCRDKERLRIMRKINRLLDALPELIMQTMPTGPEGNWLRFYRILTQIHSLLEDAGLGLEADEYMAVTRKMTALAGAVAEASAVRIDGASTFALLLAQLVIVKNSPKRKKKRAARTQKKPSKPKK